MSALFAFLHHLFAFMLVAAIAVEFVLIGQATSNAQPGAQNNGSVGNSGLTHAIAKRLVAADAALGMAAGRPAAPRRPSPRVLLREGRELLFP